MDFLKNNRLALHLFMGVLLTMIYPMQELFSGNQNIYFLWGMADLLPNAFTADPLLNSPDPYPLFSWLISIFPVQFLVVWTGFLYILLNAVYSFSLFGIANQVAGIYYQKSRLFSFFAFFLFLHTSPIWGTYFKLIADVDLRWVWDSGIAEQGVLRGYLQPSVFGVFLLLSFYFASRRNFAAAILSIAPAAAIHANYLFLGGILTLIYLLQARFERRSIIASALLLLMALPYSIYVLNHFLLLDADTKNAINQAVMAGYESNIHINPSNWLNAKFFLQLGVLLIGLIAIWNTRFRTLFLSMLGIAVTLTAIAYATDNTTLISLNPWRFSILLIPVSVVAILSKIVESGLWNLLRPTSIAVIGSVCVMLVYYRVFGNASGAFHNQWLMIHSALTAGTVTIIILLAKREWFSKLLEPLLVIALLVVGTTDIFVERSTKENAEQFQAITNLKGSEPNTTYIIPPDWTSFRMNAEKAVFVDENLVYGPALPSLMQRLEMATIASETNDYSEILDSIPFGTSVKLIAPNNQVIEAAISNEHTTANYTCYVLR
ncbi:MAG: hypothetical protein K9J17_04330 [Flavobacteriales bacterium]|nr:hypothetical protein [Flavobacteriales bacterium]